MTSAQAQPTTSGISMFIPTVIALVLMAAAAMLFVPSKQTVTIQVGNAQVNVDTRAPRVRDLLTHLGISLRPEDTVDPPLDTPLEPGMTIRIERARPVILEVAGRRAVHFTRAARVSDVLAEAGVLVHDGDEVRLEGEPVPVDARLPAPSWQHTSEATLPWDRTIAPISLSVRRAIPLLVTDEGATYTVRTTAATVGQALHDAGVPIYLGDEVYPGLGEPVSAYMRVVIRRSIPIVVQADGKTLQTRTRAPTVADALAEQGVFLSGLDVVTPPLATPIREGMRIRVTRVSEFVQVEDERIPFDTVYVPDDDLEIDRRRVVTSGRPGIFRRRYQVRVEDGVEVSRELIDAWVAQEPITNVIAYGRKIVTRTLETPDGVITYWRRIRMLATSYSKSTAGVSPDRPWYGITRLGIPMRHGIVAVDPRVIPLGSNVYVPGYGKGYAADTGSRILGRRIDLGYDDDNLVLWYKWVDVYLLAPPPPKDKINYLLPNWPRPPR